MSYSVLILRSAQKALGAIPVSIQNRLIIAMCKLETNPRPSGVKKLSGREAWRIRVNNYRIIYEISDTQFTILVVDIGHRSAIYK